MEEDIQEYSKRQASKDDGVIAGLNVLRVINKASVSPVNSTVLKGKEFYRFVHFFQLCENQVFQ